MARQDQLEIISPTGEVSFVNLDNATGISNIGRHPENDIVLNSPAVGLFHAVLDHRQRPLKVMLLSSEGESMVAGQRLQLNVPSGMNPWDTLALGGYSLILFQEGAAGGNGNGLAGLPLAVGGGAVGSGAAAAVAPGGGAASAASGAAADAKGKAAGAAEKLSGNPAGAKAMEAAAPAQEAAQGAMTKIAPPAALGPLSGLLSKFPFGKQAQVDLAGDDASVGGIMPVATPPLTVTPLAALPSDRADESIITEISGRAWTVDAGQTASFELSIVNGGDIVASFDVAIDGLEPSWYVITPPTVNLNEGQRASVVVNMLTPRLPTSGAGAHFFAVTVTSPNYAGHASQKGATLTINPYYEYAVGELVPREQSIGYRKRFAQETLTLVNKGNSTTTYRLDGDDPERGCSFEFVVPGHSAGLAKQVELVVDANTIAQVPIRVTPLHRHLIALRSHMYTLTVTTTPQEGQQSPRSVLAQLHASPLIGKWTILFTILAIIALIIIIFRPTIDEFKADRTKVPANTPVTLTWRASPFANLRIDHTSTESLGALSATSGSVQVHPDQQPTKYTLVAENLLTRINSQWFGDSRTVQIVVDSVYPVARFTMVLPDGKPITAPSSAALSIMHGESITLYWEVQNSDTIILSSNGAAETIPLTDQIGKRTLTPDKDTIYSLAAANKFGEDKQLLGVTVKEPPTVTPTPSPTVPPPVILQFDVVPAVITAGQTIKLTWEVANADTVVIQGLQNVSSLPPKGSIEQSPPNTTSYVLSAGPNTVPMQRDVTVNPAPTATPTPVAPRITTFQLTRTDVVRGSPEASDIQLIWMVTGATTNVEISGPDLPKLSNQSAQGSLPIIGTKPTLFVITAFNGDLVASQTVNLNVTEPTATPTATPTGTPPPTPLPNASFTFVRVNNVDGKSGDVVQLTSSSSNIVKYQVTAGTTVQFVWDTQNAAKLTLVTYGDQPPTGNLNILITQQKSPYQLLASNAASPPQSTSFFIDITVKPRPAPPAPTILASSKAGITANTINWSYSDISQIIGYRVYRADGSSTTYTRIADETTLKPSVQTYTDNVTPTCGRTYSVVAVYTDISEPDPTKATKETSRSAAIWKSSPCGP